MINRLVVFFTIGIATACCGCLATLTYLATDRAIENIRSPIKLYHDNVRMRDELLEHLKELTSADAKRTMERRGFDCNHWPNCDMVYRRRLVTVDEISVRVKEHDGVVENVEVNCYSVGM